MNSDKVTSEKRTGLTSLLLLVIGLCSSNAGAWVYSGADPGGSKYSPLTQVNANNVHTLTHAWTARSGEHSTLPPEVYRHSTMQSTPILLPPAAGEHLIVCSANNYLIALDPETGAERWRYDPQVPLEKRGISYKCRGNAYYWENTAAAENAACRHRLFMGTLDRRMVAVDATDGKPCADFGNNGVLDLLRDEERGFSEAMVFSTSQPVVANGKVIIGSSIRDLVFKNTPAGTINAYDAIDGSEQWIFRIIPTDEDPSAARSWPSDALAQSGAANAWAPLSADEDNHLVFVPTSSPSPDFYGGHRPGDNLYANSLVALNTETGERVWHFQFVRHDLWDYDVPSQPNLFDFQQDGSTVPAVLQVTKQGMVFVFNRLTGEPLVPIEDRSVPSSNIPGETTASHQPFSAIAPLIGQTITEDDMWGFTPVDRWLCKKRLTELENNGIYTAPGFEEPALHYPFDGGGANWGGAAISPDGILLVNMMDVPQTLELRRASTLQEGASKANPKEYLAAGYMPMHGTEFLFEKLPWLSPLGIPCTAPPWNKLVALDVARGNVLWEVPLGSIHDMAPFPVPFEINGFGSPGIGSGALTAGGIFVLGGTSDRRIRAFDTRTGEVLWSHKLPVDAMSGVSTYMHKGRQYFVTTAGGHDQMGRESGDYIIAFRLPD